MAKRNPKNPNKAKPQEKTKKKPWYKKPAFIISAAALGASTLAASLGILNYHHEPAPRPGFRERLQNANQDTRHIVPGQKYQLKIWTSRRGANVGFPTDAKCASCHNVQSLPEQIGERLLNDEQKVRSLFPSEHILYNLKDAYVALNADPLPKNPGGGEVAAQNSTLGIRYYLPAFADPEVQTQVRAHEIAHYLTKRMEDGLNEVWAAPANLFCIKPKDASDVDDFGVGGKYLAALQRAAVLSGRRPERLETYSDQSQLQKALHQVLGYVGSKELDSFKPVFKESFREYRRQPIFWDAAAYKLQNPYVLYDVLIARKLLETDSAITNAIATGIAASSAQNLQQFGQMETQKRMDALKRFFGRAPTMQEVQRDMDNAGGDMRQMISRTMTRNTQRQIDGAYYSALIHMFGPGVAPRYDLMDQKELENHAQLKIGMLDEFLALAKKETLTQIPRLNQAIRESQASRTDLVRRIQTKRFIY